MSAPQASVLQQVSRIVHSGLSLDEMLGQLVGLASRVTECDACLVYLMEPGGTEVVLRASQLPHARELGTLRVKFGEGVTGWVAEHKSPVAIGRNAARDERFKRFAALVEDTYEAFLSVPLVSSGELVGVLNVHHLDAREHTPEELALMTFLGEQIGGAIVASRLAAENERLAREAEQVRKQLERRKLVERAKGVLQRRHSLTEEAAYLRLRNDSRRQRRPMWQLADDIINADEANRRKRAAVVGPGDPSEF